MAALEEFEGIAALRAEVARLESEVAAAYAAAGPHGQRMGSIGGSSRRDPLAGIDELVDSDAMATLDRKRALLEERMTKATDVLYGRSGNGGVAKALCSDDADMLCYHYLQGEGWASIARRYNPESSNLSLWCMRHAAKVCRSIDAMGMEKLADS